MDTRHPKTVRRRILQALYQRYLHDPLDMAAPQDVMDDAGVAREDLVANVYYLQDRGLIELLMGYNPPLFAAARMTADGIDLVENAFQFNLRFPPAPGEIEEALATVPILLERLVQEADFSPLDGEARQALLRDVQYLRDEVARPAVRWRIDVIRAVLNWIEGHFAHCEAPAREALPSLADLREALDRECEADRV